MTEALLSEKAEAPKTQGDPHQGSGQVGDDLIESMPQLKHEVPGAQTGGTVLDPGPITAPQVPAASPPGKFARYAHLRDSEGNSFDPKIHQNNHGRPKVSKKGLLKKWVGPRGRRQDEESQPSESRMDALGDQAGTEIEELNQPQKPEMTPAQVEAAGRALGTVAASLVFQIGVSLGGEEWHPQKNSEMGLDERANMERAFGDYFIATGKTDFPPGLALSLALAAYALPRFTMPKTQSRLALATAWLSNKWTAYRLWRQRKKSAGETVLQSAGS